MSSKIDRAIKGQILLPKAHGALLKNKPLNFDKTVCAFDIEADAETAKPFLLSFSTPLRNGTIQLRNAKQVLEFLTSHGFRNTINFFYNIQYDFEGILKLFPKKIALLIYGNSSCSINEDLEEDEENWKYKILYIPKKGFIIKTRAGKKYCFYDLLQYYNCSLNKAGETYLNKHKKGDVDSSKMSYNRFKKDSGYRHKVIDYAIQDAIIAKELGEIIINAVNSFVNIKKFTSIATISEYYFRSNGLVIPQFSQSVLKKFMQAYYGGRFEITKRGYLKNVNIYDIKSAYPFAMTKMPILSKGAMVKNIKSVHDRALYGSYCISIDIGESYISPLAIRESILKFPIGGFNNYWVDKITLEFLDKLGYDITIIKGVEIYDNNPSSVLGDLINKLYYEYKENKNWPKPVRNAAKIILNALYGKFIQLMDDTVLDLVNDLEELNELSGSDIFELDNEYYKRVHTDNFKTGKMFAPYYASFITSFTRKQLFEKALSVGEEKVIGFHTDSLMMQGAKIDEGNKLGDWEIDKTSNGERLEGIDLVLLKSGFYKASKGNIEKIRTRGIGFTDNILRTEFEVKRRYGLKQAVKKDFDDMNIIRWQTITNNINTDLKRVWDEELTRELIKEEKWIDSKPLTI